MERRYSPLRRTFGYWTDTARILFAGKSSKRRLALHVLLYVLLAAVALWLASLVLPGFTISGFGAAVAAVIVIALVNATLRPLLVFIMLPVAVVTFGLLTLFLNAAMLWLTSELVSGFEIGNFWYALLGSLVFIVINTFFLAILNVNEGQSLYRALANREAQRQNGSNAGRPARGVVMVQIDGLGYEVLRFALRTGLMPNLARLVRSGSHRVVEWECGLPSQTSASQAGILYGNNSGIPAFRWYEKGTERIFVSNRPKDAVEIAARASNGTGLLADGGASLGNIFSGDAAVSQLTMATLTSHTRSADFASYFVNPDSFPRSLIFMLREVVLEWWQGRKQAFRKVEPRVARHGSYPFLRAITCVYMRDLTVSMALDRMYVGAPAIYMDFLGYDEIAHHAGPERPESLAELSNLDHQIGLLETAASEAPTKYDIVVLSDHGQSQGATFRQRYGRTLEQLIEELAGVSDADVQSKGTTEDWGHLNAVLTETFRAMGSVGRGLSRVVFRRRALDGAVDVGPDRSSAPDGPGQVVVSASGNLALVNFTRWKERASLEMVQEAYPGLVESLATHDGIGFVMARSQENGALARGRGGTRFLADDTVEGEDPLGKYDGHIADHLRRLDSFSNCGDLVIISRFDPQTGEVAAFEELVGSHGGAGGPQTRPFLLFPARWEAPQESIVGAEQVYAQLKRWLATLGGVPQTAQAGPR